MDEQLVTCDMNSTPHKRDVGGRCVNPKVTAVQPGPNVHRGDDGIDRVLGISSGPPAVQSPPPASERGEYTLVPNSALRWLFGEEGDFVAPEEAYLPGSFTKRPYWWRSEFRKRIAESALSERGAPGRVIIDLATEAMAKHWDSCKDCSYNAETGYHELCDMGTKLYYDELATPPTPDPASGKEGG